MNINDLFKINRSPINFMIFGFMLITISGLALGGFYFILDTTHSSLLGMDCVLADNAFGSSCQDLFSMVVYPFLEAKDILVYLSMALIFILVIGMLLSGYNSGTHPKMLGVLFLLEIAITYGSLWIANIYRDLLAIDIIRTALVEFTVYNKVLLYFPWFIFIVSLFSIILGVINFQRVKVNSTTEELNF